MKAFVVRSYGEDGLRAVDLPTPAVGNRDVLVEMRAASVKPPRHDGPQGSSSS